MQKKSQFCVSQNMRLDKCTDNFGGPTISRSLAFSLVAGGTLR